MITMNYRRMTAIVLGIYLGASFPVQADTYTVYPSRDTSGNTDYANIQSAMQSAAAGGTVRLAAGNFYVNQGIVVTGFSGTLRGTLNESDDTILTTLEAVAPFTYSHTTAYIPDLPWTEDYDDGIMPSVIFLEFPEGQFTVRDLIFVANESSYVDFRPMWGDPRPAWSTTALTQFIADFGNDADPSYLNLTFIAGEGDFFGSNVAAAIHSMRGPGCSEPCNRIGNPLLHGIGNAVFKRIRSSHVKDYAVVPMWYRNGSIVVKDVVSDTSMAVGPWGMIDVTMRITDIESSDSWRSLGLAHIFGGDTRVRGLNSYGGVNPAIFINNSRNVDVRDSMVFGGNGFGEWWRAPVFIATNSHNIQIVDNAILDTINVPSGVMALSDRGNSDVDIRNNYYDPDIFTGPPGAFAVILGSDNSQVVEPGLQPEHVLDLGSNNTIKVGGM